MNGDFYPTFLPDFTDNQNVPFSGPPKNTGFSSKGDEVYIPSKEDKSIPIESFSDRDQIWLEEFKIFRYGKIK